MELNPIDEKIDFNLIGRDGGSIFRMCLSPALKVKQYKTLSRNPNSSVFTQNIHTRKVTRGYWQNFLESSVKLMDEMSLITPAIEERFFMLVKAGQKYGYDTDQLIERPDPIGSTVFEAATQFSAKICQYILGRKIRVNNVLANFVYPVFNIKLFNDEILEQMLLKGINPKVISGKDFSLSVNKNKFLFQPTKLIA